MKRTCKRNMAHRDEDCGNRIAYTPCGEPAPYLVNETWHACERHAVEAKQDDQDVQ